MRVHPTRLPGVLVIEPEPVSDERGFFARVWSRAEMQAIGLAAAFAHLSVSYNTSRGTLRGMHYQAEPMAEVKVVRCTQGAVYDVAVDLRQDSPTFRQWVAVELTAANHTALYIPRGCAHGFQTLNDHTEVLYAIDAEYSPAHARGVRWNDPSFGIEWPPGPRIMNDRDRSYPDFAV